MKVYDVEISSMPKHRSSTAIEAYAKYYGLMSHENYAEPFKIIRSII